MGVSIATAAVKSIESEAINVVNDFTSKCSLVAKQTSVFNLGKDCTFKGNTLSNNSSSGISNACRTQITTNNTLAQSMKSQVGQKAQAVTQTLGLGIADSNSFINQSIMLSDSITNHFVNQCVTSTNQTTEFNCKGADVEDNIFIFKQNQNAGQTCVADFMANNDIKQNMVAIIAQKSSAAQSADLALAIIIAIAFIIIGILFFTMQELRGPLGWLIVFLVLGLILFAGIYAYFAPRRNYYPYRRPN